ncbi:uncharacterized protein [Gossypium hirsutum]|uniref:Reverse transcriptase domain-containing protein n=1 Tax=Gossypium hirsutum TaxID=3635 RepID=A0ABM2ZNJ4_GOSHI|nr:uncharacterized protein LOC121214531 [Gossypium hirsutum]
MAQLGHNAAIPPMQQHNVNNPLLPQDARIQNRTIRDFVIPILDNLQREVVRPTIQAGNFELKPVMFQMLNSNRQYVGLPHEDVKEHLKSFLLICSLPSDTKNPSLRGKKHCKAITLRSGKQTGEPFITSTVAPQDTDGVITDEKVESKEFFNASDKEVPQVVTHMPTVRPWKLSMQSKVLAQADISLPLPFAQRFRKNEHDKQYQQLLDTLKQLHINIPLVDALVQIMSYGKFMKDLLSKKKKLTDIKTIALTEGCSAVLINKLPFKLKDPWSFTIPCSIDKEIPIILGRPFFSTVQTLIDAYKGELIMRLNDKLATFNVFKSVQCKDKEECHTIDMLDDLIEEELNDQNIVLSKEFAVTSDADFLDDCDSMVKANNLKLKHGWQIESLNLANKTTQIFKEFIKEAPILELKPLPHHLKYVFLGEHNTLPVIIPATLDVPQEEKLVHILKQHK